MHSQRSRNPQTSAPKKSNPIRSAPPSPSKSTFAQPAVVFAVALSLRLLHLFAMKNSILFEVLVSDGWKYDRWGREIASGNWLGNEIFYQTPLYPYLLGTLYSVVGQDVWWARVAQALAGSLACVMLASTGSRVFDPRVGWVAGLLLAFYPPAIFFDGIVQKASLDSLLVCVLLWTIAVCQSKPRLVGFLGVGGALGAFILNRENAAGLVPIMFLWIVFESWRRFSLTCSRVGYFLLGMGLFLIPVGLRNLHVGGAFLVTTSQMGPNFYIGNHRGASGAYESLRPLRGDPRFESEDARILAEEDLGRELSPSEISNYWMRRAWRDIRDQPLAWLNLLGRKTLLTVHSWELADSESLRVYLRESSVLRFPNYVWNFGVLVPLATLGLWLTRRDWRRLWVFHAMLAAFAFAVILFYVFSRYRYPLVPLLVLFAAGGLVRALDCIRYSRPDARRELLLGALGVVLAGVVCHWPIAKVEDDEVTYINVGTALLDEGRPQEAVEALSLAAEMKPDFAGTYVNLGLAYFALGDLPAAEAEFHKSLELDPGLAAAYYCIGRVHAKREEYDAAIASLRQAIEKDPLLPEPHHLLGQIRIRRADWSSGVASLRRAAELDPRAAAIHHDLATALLQSGDAAQAVVVLRAFVRRDASATGIVNNLAWILATYPKESVRNPREALRLAEQVNASVPGQANFLDTLAAAQAAVGDFASADETVARALEVAEKAGHQEVVAILESRQRVYRARKPFLDDSLLVVPR